MTGPVPHPRTLPPPVAVGEVAPGDLILLGGRWTEVVALGVDGPRVTVVVPGRKPLRYERDARLVVIRQSRAQQANPGFYQQVGPAVFESRLVDRITDWLFRRRPRRRGR